MENEVKLIEITNERRLETLLTSKWKGDVLIINSCIETAEIVLRIAKKMKKRVKKIIVSGPVTFLPKVLLFKKTPIDVIVIGEPEETVRELIENFKENKDIKEVRGIAYFERKIVINPPRRFILKLKNLPYPYPTLFKDYEFFYPVRLIGRMKIGFVLSSRGCPYDCSFCSPNTRISYGKKLRIRSIEDVVREIEILKKNGINVIYFRDDCFGINKKWVEKFCRELIKRKIKIKWVAQMRIDNINGKIARLMRLAGCSTLCLGIESGSDRILKVIKKGINLREIKRTIKILKEVGIWTVAFFIIGNPGERKSEIFQTIRFAKELKPEMIQVHIFSTYPSSLVVNASKNFNIGSKFCPMASACRVDPNELKSLQKFFYKSFYFDYQFLTKFFVRQSLFFILNFKLGYKLFVQTIKFLLGR